MNKWEVKRILNTMRTPYNEKEVNLVLARVDMTPDFRLEKLIAEFGNDKNAVIQYFQENIDQMCDRNDDKVEPFNDNKYVKYWVMRESFCMSVDTRDLLSDSFVMSIDTRGVQEDLNGLSEVEDEELVQEIESYARSMQKDVATLHMFDSMKKLMERIDSNDQQVAKLKDICVFFEGEIDIPEEFFESSTLLDKDTLTNINKLEKDSNLRKAVQIYGTDTQLKMVTISMETFKSKEFRNMMFEKMKEIEERGVEVELAEQGKEDVTQCAPSKSALENDDREQ